MAFIKDSGMVDIQLIRLGLDRLGLKQKSPAEAGL
jgi:hypothetical protein